MHEDTRVERVIWIPGISCEPGEDFGGFVEDLQEGYDFSQLRPDLPWLGRIMDNGLRDGCADDLANEFAERRTPGFLVEIAAQVPRGFNEDMTQWRTGWGMSRRTWFYAKDISKVHRLSRDWAERVVADEKRSWTNARRGASKK